MKTLLKKYEIGLKMLGNVLKEERGYFLKMQVVHLH